MRKDDIILLIPNIEYGGAQRSFVSLANALSDDFNVIVCVFYIPGKIGFNLNEQIKIHELDPESSDNILGKVKSFQSRLNKLNHYISSYKVETVISYLEGANYLNCLSIAKNKIISLRGSIYSDQNINGVIGYLRKFALMPLIYSKADSIIVLNEGIKREVASMKTIPSNKVRVIPNFYDSNGIQLESKMAKPGGFEKLYLESNILVSAGRLAPEKGLNYLLRIFYKFDKSNKNFKLIIVGDGTEKISLLRIAEEYFGTRLIWQEGMNSDFLSLKDKKVFFVGYDKNPYRWIQGSKAFILTSTAEGGPNVLNEAMIVGTPVISADCPDGPRRIITGKVTKPANITYPQIFDRGVLMPAFLPSDPLEDKKI
ncbi:glycosyltransferase [Mangrovivirga cuniculi]|uniref:Glycosyltransferase subfamily 4-like N-terminal domain-containing protein n=1 Tax=Mangrovivirga cuniculi TaxID=2715131 RepID=A0A4D7JKQ0_9BACT|nr:glycosyltransferase [Mangrovivirga cuniculi]QCK16489.1 hypothetical protein DCC35_18010 [Mangrovivirga cuniculi]